MAKYSARRAFFWQLIAKNRKRRLAIHTALSTGYQRRQLLLQVACLTVLLLANNNGAAVLSRSCHRLQRNANLWTGPLTARNGLKSSGYLDLHLSFYWIAFVTPLKKHRHWRAWYRLARNSRKRNCLCTAHARQGENSVWQMGESVFLWRLRSPSHLNQLFCNLQELWIEFSVCLERRLLKRRTGTIASSDLASRTYAGVEPINLSRT